MWHDADVIFAGAVRAERFVGMYVGDLPRASGIWLIRAKVPNVAFGESFECMSTRAVIDDFGTLRALERMQ
jgi:hypothetical protein